MSATLRSARNVDYTTADLQSPHVMVNMDITQIPSPDRSFDAVICNHVLEHIPDDKKAMSELLRVLRPGGWAILQVPVSLTLPRTYEDPSITTDDGRAEAFGQEDHVRIYTPGDYQERLTNVGFRVQAFRWTADPENFGGEANRFGLNPDEKVYYVQSP